mmetsp:Transcript_18006/g.38860  ORF Transcript_18006/g.38860 Transcript_18006/m.38860 type:complete len:255 (+) Transcript_18006:280-1044(+)
MSDSVESIVDKEPIVTIEQRLLKVDEVFVYRIPPMRSADGHRAEDWNLASPLETCSLRVVRRDDNLCVDIMADRPKKDGPEGATETHLFAQSNMTVDFSKPSHKIEHWVVPVIDSSRYFALKIQDARSGREAFIGVGFRERLDATNFRFSLDDYINSLKRQKEAVKLQKQYQQKSVENQSKGGNITSSSFSLKEGEKIHVNIKMKPGGTTSKKAPTSVKLKGLKLPPPPPPSGESSAQGNENQPDSVEWDDFQG